MKAIVKAMVGCLCVASFSFADNQRAELEAAMKRSDSLVAYQRRHCNSSISSNSLCNPDREKAPDDHKAFEVVVLTTALTATFFVLVATWGTTIAHAFQPKSSM